MRDSVNSAIREKPDIHFDDALAVVDRDDLAYEERLALLRRWLVRIAEGRAARGTRQELEGAIIALQARSKLKMDMPDEQPETTNYGGVERTDLRLDAVRRLIEGIRRVFRA